MSGSVRGRRRGARRRAGGRFVGKAAPESLDLRTGEIVRVVQFSLWEPVEAPSERWRDDPDDAIPF